MNVFYKLNYINPFQLPFYTKTDKKKKKKDTLTNRCPKNIIYLT